jgi:hypothetical protein
LMGDIVRRLRCSDEGGVDSRVGLLI